MSRYVNILKDSGFKAVFGDQENKEVIIGFLNTVLAGEHVVTDVEFMNNEVFGKTVDARAVRYDLHCKDKDGVRFVVEMQRVSHSRDFFQRSVYYGCKLYDFQHEDLKGRYDAKPVYVVAIMEGALCHEAKQKRDPSQSCVSRYKLYETDKNLFGPNTISCIYSYGFSKCCQIYFHHF
ncbi:MAG: Rpn family recombination-promoting nuclease/putative transposase, partial [Bacteroidales bacterium]|nr:Rpn family recombination-promoting nuclease/putative transposase [Bacteroidales bacterium]